MADADDSDDPVEVLARGGADLVVGSVFPTLPRSRAFTISDGFADDTVRCFVVPEHKVPRWKYPYAVLQPEVWVCLAAAMVSLGNVPCIITSVNERHLFSANVMSFSLESEPYHIGLYVAWVSLRVRTVTRWTDSRCNQCLNE